MRCAEPFWLDVLSAAQRLCRLIEVNHRALLMIGLQRPFTVCHQSVGGAPWYLEITWMFREHERDKKGCVMRRKGGGGWREKRWERESGREERIHAGRWCYINGLGNEVTGTLCRKLFCSTLLTSAQWSLSLPRLLIHHWRMHRSRTETVGEVRGARREGESISGGWGGAGCDNWRGRREKWEKGEEYKK